MLAARKKSSASNRARSPRHWNAPSVGTRTTVTSCRAAPKRLPPREPPDMRILVTFAVEAEFAPWRRARNLKQRKIADFVVYEAKIGRASVDFVVTGMGLESAAAGTRSVLSKEHDFCIAS